MEKWKGMDLNAMHVKQKQTELVIPQSTKMAD